MAKNLFAKENISNSFDDIFDEKNICTEEIFCIENICEKTVHEENAWVEDICEEDFLNASNISDEVALYKSMYYKIFNHLSNISNMIEKVQKETEDFYISAGVQD